MKKIVSFVLLLFCIISITSCSDDDIVVGPGSVVNSTTEVPAGYGTVTFELTRYNVYTINNLSLVKTIEITVVDKNAKLYKLSSLEVSGTDDMVSTAAVVLPVGHYMIQSYRCFDKNADLIEDLDITMNMENEFDIQEKTSTAKTLTIQVKQVLSLSNVYNSLYGLCLEVCGSDKSKWPKSWNFDSEGIDGTWAGLEFEWDVDTNSPAELIGIVINGEEDYIINSDTWEQELVSLPEFKHMKRLPGCIGDLKALENITIMNCDLEEIDPNLCVSPIVSLSITNTKLKSIPESLGKLSKLTDVYLEGNDLQEFPTAFTQCETIEFFTIKDEPSVKSVPEGIGNWGTKLISLNISGTGIALLPDVFDKLWKVSTLELADNPNLSTLPTTLGLEQIPYSGGDFTNTSITGLILDGCAFTSIPDVAKRKHLQMLSMRNCKLTSLSKADFDAMTDLQSLYLDDNKFTEFPALTNPKLAYLSLMRCGLHKSQVDVSGLPMLNPQWGFYCDE